jgi:protein SCO1/2
MRSRRNVQLLVLAALGCAFVAAAFYVSRLRQQQASSLPVSAPEGGTPPLFWPVPAFELPDQHGRTTKKSDLAGKIWIADFIFTHCTTVCPRITAQMALLQRRITSDRVRFVSFSVDPENDTEAALLAYANTWRPSEKRWLLFRTTDQSLGELVKGMRVAVEKTNDKVNPIVHTSMFFLVDERGDVRGAYDSGDDDRLKALVRDVEQLLGTAVATPASQKPSGEAVYMSLGCGACHARSELAPSLDGVLGRSVALEEGGMLVADAAYVKESIVSPETKLVRGYLKLMPAYRDLSEPELEALVGYVSALRAPAPAEAGVEPVATLALDPVCEMRVRVGKETPSAEHAGRTFHFCSESCRSEFSAHPDRYLDAGKF